MKKNLYIYLTLLTVISVNSQNTTNIDSLKYKSKYILTYQSDSTNINSIESEEMLLLIGEKSSKFLSLSSFLRDSISNNIDKGNINSLNLMTLFQSVPKTKFKSKIFKNYPNGKITTTEQVLRNYYKYEDSLTLFNWKIEKEIKIISGYKCQKATTSYAGRGYIAWFAYEVPISDGPFKFNGLPGLIIQINDLDNHYEYKLVSLEKTKIKSSIEINNENYILTSRKELEVVKKEFYANIFKKIEETGININFDNPNQKRSIINKYKKRNNPIELDY